MFYEQESRTVSSDVYRHAVTGPELRLCYLSHAPFPIQLQAVEIKQHATAPPVHVPACFPNTTGLQVLTCCFWPYTHTHAHTSVSIRATEHVIVDWRHRETGWQPGRGCECEITIEPLWLTAAFLCFPFPELYYCAPKIAFDATIAIGYCASCKNPERFFKTNLAFREILWTRWSVQFHSLSKHGIAYACGKARNHALNLKKQHEYKVCLLHLIGRWKSYSSFQDSQSVLGPWADALVIRPATFPRPATWLNA